MGFSLRRLVNSIPVVGGIGSSIWGDPDQEAHQKAMKRASGQAAQYRPELMNSRMNAISQMSQAFEPMNQMMQQVYGGGQPGKGPTGGMMDIEAMTQNPMSQGMQDQMYQSAFGTNAPPRTGPAFSPNPSAAFNIPPGPRR
jgi:hypothetical protein